MSEQHVTIVCVPREVFSMTEESLETLYARTSTPFNLVYVDGGSPPDVRQYLEGAARKYNFTLLRTEQYLTPNQARNRGLNYVTTPYVCFVDNDVLVAENWLEALLQCAQETGAWAVSPLYFEHMPEQHCLHMAGGKCDIFEDDPNTRYCVEKHLYGHKLLADVDEPLKRHETGLFEFHTVFLDMAVFEAIGPLDEGLMSSSEHADLSLLIRARGERIVLEPNSAITYAPPKKLTKDDRAFFELRWSEAWNHASVAHFLEKWNLSSNHGTVRQQYFWLTEHRLFGSRTANLVKMLLGSPVARRIRRRIIMRIEPWFNRLKFPLDKHGHTAPFDTSVSYSFSPSSEKS